MKFFAIPVFLLTFNALWARPWHKLMATEPVSIQVQPLESFELQNNIKVYFKKNNLLPRINIQVIIEGGDSEETRESAGINSLWGKAVAFSGSKKYPRDKLAEILEMRGSDFGFSNSLERSTFVLESLTDYFESDLEIVTDVLNNPAFNDEDVELLKSQALQSILKRNENPAGMAYIAGQLILWKDNIRGLISTSNTVKSFKSQQMEVWHRNMMSADRVTILATGDFEPGNLKKILEKNFGQLRKSATTYDAAMLKVSPQMQKPGGSVVYHQVKEIPQTTILFRAHGLPHAHKDYYALKLYDFLLGGDSFNSYLTQIIRVKNGWSYSVYSTYSTGPEAGSLSIFAQTRNQNVLPLINEVTNILAKPELFITAEKLASAKNSIRNSFVFLAETPEKLAGLQLSLKWDNLPDTYLNNFLAEIDKVTVEDLTRIARTYYVPENFFICIVGPENVITGKNVQAGTGLATVKYSIPQ